jgi:hypothetical protein
MLSSLLQESVAKAVSSKKKRFMLKQNRI